jgi:hypothetical protein
MVQGSKLTLMAEAARGKPQAQEYALEASVIACGLLRRSGAGGLEPEPDKLHFALVFERGEPTYALSLHEWSPRSKSFKEFGKLQLTDEKVFELKHLDPQ